MNSVNKLFQIINLKPVSSVASNDTKRILYNSKLSNTIRSYCSNAQLESNQPEKSQQFNYVRIRGTVVGDPRPLINGVKSLIVRTTAIGNIYCNHHVNVRTEEHIRKDDRVYVAGYLSSKNQFLDNGQIRHILTIKGHHIQLKERNETTAAENDINQIKILAQICAEIRHTDKYSLFTVMATHTPSGEGQIAGLERTQFHRILVFDQKTINVLKQTISEKDFVIVDGRLQYQPFQTAGGGKKHGGFIVAKHVQRFVM